MDKDQKSNIQSIKYITIFPKRKDKWKYFLNNNFKDFYTLKTGDLIKFIFSTCESSISEYVNKYISNFEPFLIDVENNKVHHLTINLEQAKEKFVNGFWKQERDVDKAFKKFSANEKKRSANTHEILHVKENESLLDKFTFIE